MRTLAISRVTAGVLAVSLVAPCVAFAQSRNSGAGPGTGPNFKSNSVQGHIRRDGTFVAPHMRSNPDSSFGNNWSASPNVNPYTGQQGTRMTPPNPYGNPYGNPYRK
jgi:hypothetical protein